jgi:hypothetical protein
VNWEITIDKDDHVGTGWIMDRRAVERAVMIMAMTMMTARGRRTRRVVRKGLGKGREQRMRRGNGRRLGTGRGTGSERMKERRTETGTVTGKGKVLSNTPQGEIAPRVVERFQGARGITHRGLTRAGIFRGAQPVHVLK